MTERLLRILINSFGTILLPGLTVTIPLTILSFGFALVIAVTVALVQFAHVPVLEKLARLYIWIIRGTPVLVQLFVVFYGLPGVGILIEPFPAAVLVFLRYHQVAQKQFGGISGDLAGWFLQKAELWMLAALVVCQVLEEQVR